MINTYLTIAVSVVMGLSIFVSMPVVFRNTHSLRKMLFYNAIAAGILVFLLLDIYGNVAAVFGNASITDPYEILFIVAFFLTFLFFIFPKSGRDPLQSPKRTSALAALGIGFQNLTEGLVFGSAGAAGIVPIYVLAAIGFTLQDITEGFPIAAPLIGLRKKVEKKFVASVFLLGGIPAVIGTLIGLNFYSTAFIVLFDALASAAILYVVLVLFHINIDRGNKKEKQSSTHLTYLGILIGFVAAYIVNYLIVA
ncbi:MAG: hypothetical protein KGH98_01060 [Candidatus Micrarchaeota archaeon]|nr:hypothetical protein [Candidatus Micrarchaeota archaeon]